MVYTVSFSVLVLVALLWWVLCVLILFRLAFWCLWVCGRCVVCCGVAAYFGVFGLGVSAFVFCGFLVFTWVWCFCLGCLYFCVLCGFGLILFVRILNGVGILVVFGCCCLWFCRM